MSGVSESQSKCQTVSGISSVNDNDKPDKNSAYFEDWNGKKPLPNSFVRLFDKSFKRAFP
jgi:hypothetical protein